LCQEIERVYILAVWSAFRGAGRAITQERLLQQAGQMLGDFEVPYFTPLVF
jgi:hypothetical protein